jgi:D-aminopeptidase
MYVTAPIRLEVAFFRPIQADLAGLLPGAERVNGTTVAYTAQDMDTLNRAWIMMPPPPAANPVAMGNRRNL